MNYAHLSDATYVTRQKSLKKTPLSVEAKERRDFIRSHKFTVDVDQKTQKCTLHISEKSTNR